jgi:hypothetical protein
LYSFSKKIFCFSPRDPVHLDFTMAIYSAVPPPPELGGNEGNSSQAHNTDENGLQQQQQQEQHNATNTSSAAYNTSMPSLPTNSNGGVDIEAWTIEALQSLNVSPVARGTGAQLSIPLDETDAKIKKASVSIYDPRRAGCGGGITPPPRPSSRRDSLRRREALLKGNEGSRQRRRWENGKPLPPLPPSLRSPIFYFYLFIFFRPPNTQEEGGRKVK